MTAMLASVRSLAEAHLVADCGVDWIDLKEPASGALGAVEPNVIADVARHLGGRFRISATIGDCWDTPAVIPARVAATQRAGAGYVKVGAYAARPSPGLLAALTTACASAARVIVVCFAEAPPAAAALAALAATGVEGVMLDTADKQGPGLRGLMSATALQAFTDEARRLGLLSGLAGRLALEDIEPLLQHAPDYLGFRGALCSAAERTGELDAARVRDVRRRVVSPAVAVGP